MCGRKKRTTNPGGKERKRGGGEGFFSSGRKLLWLGPGWLAGLGPGVGGGREEGPQYVLSGKKKTMYEQEAEEEEGSKVFPSSPSFPPPFRPGGGSP